MCECISTYTIDIYTQTYTYRQREGNDNSNYVRKNSQKKIKLRKKKETKNNVEKKLRFYLPRDCNSSKSLRYREFGRDVLGPSTSEVCFQNWDNFDETYIKLTTYSNVKKNKN